MASGGRFPKRRDETPRSPGPLARQRVQLAQQGAHLGLRRPPSIREVRERVAPAPSSAISPDQASAAR